MSLIPVDAEYHYVQDTAPSGANAGDVWLDTSQNPPVAKIYADVGSGLEWLVDQTSSRVDANVSSRADPSEVETRAEAALADYGASTHADPDPNNRLDAAVSSRATPSDAGLSFTEEFDLEVSSGSSVTIQKDGEFEGVASGGNWGAGGFRWEVYISSRELWYGKKTIIEGSGNAIYPNTALSSGDSDLRVTNENSFAKNVRVVRKS